MQHTKKQTDKEISRPDRWSHYCPTLLGI